MKILFLDDNTERTELFLKDNPDAVCVDTASACIEQICNNNWDEIHLDHDLDGRIYVDSNEPNTGMEVVRYLLTTDSSKYINTKFIVHSYNKNAAKEMVSRLIGHNLKAYHIPFGCAGAIIIGEGEAK